MWFLFLVFGFSFYPRSVVFNFRSNMYYFSEFKVKIKFLNKNNNNKIRFLSKKIINLVFIITLSSM